MYLHFHWYDTSQPQLKCMQHVNAVYHIKYNLHTKPHKHVAMQSKCSTGDH